MAAAAAGVDERRCWGCSTTGQPFTSFHTEYGFSCDFRWKKRGRESHRVVNNFGEFKLTPRLAAAAAAVCCCW
jgi:hypothetical protein